MHFSLSSTELRLALLFPLSCLLTKVRLGVRTGENANRVFFGVANEGRDRIASLGVGLRLQNTVVIARSTLSAICKMP